MNRTRIMSLLLAATVAFTSCNRTYECYCIAEVSNFPIDPPPDHVIEGGSRKQAVNECNAYDTETIECSIK